MADIGVDPRPVLRKELERVFKNQRVIRAFEKIFDLIPPEFISQQIQLDAVALISEVAAAQSNEAVAAVVRLTAAIETLAMAPPVAPAQLPDDVAPQVELADIKATTVEAALTDSTAILIASSQALANGAAAAVGTLNNAPAAGNPTKWVTINDNGTNRQVPTW
jgi:hypothetical protein